MEFSTPSPRGLALAALITAGDLFVVDRAARLDLGVAFLLFIGATLVTLNLLFATYFESARRINEAPDDKQPAMLLSLGCLVLVIMALLVPVVVVLLWTRPD